MTLSSRQWPDLRVGAVDTGPLIQDIFRTLRDPLTSSRMRQALRTGEVRIFTTPQVAMEVTRDLGFHAQRMGASYDAAWKLWNEEYRPRLRVVDVADFAETVGQRKAALAVRQRHPPDASLALLCELLGVRAWAEDNDLMILGIGRRDWLKHEVALVDAARLEFLGYAATLTVSEGVAQIGKQAVRAYRASEAAIGRPATIAILVLLALGCGWYLSDADRRAQLAASPIMKGLASSANFSLSIVATGQRQHGEATAYLASHARDESDPITAEMRIARALASARGPMSGDALAQRAYLSRPVLDQLLVQHSRAFLRVGIDLWQLGCSYAIAL
jgi:predicted nucleic acid-binding protein